MNVNPRIRQHGDDHAAPSARGVIPFSEMTGTRRRHRVERAAWAQGSFQVAAGRNPFTPSPEPYLVAHPEREIAEVQGTAEPCWYCAACQEGNPFPAGETRGQVEIASIIAAHRHNAERHPRRWARSQNFSGTVALDEARRVTRWGADA